MFFLETAAYVDKCGLFEQKIAGFFNHKNYLFQFFEETWYMR